MSPSKVSWLKCVTSFIAIVFIVITKPCLCIRLATCCVCISGHVAFFPFLFTSLPFFRLHRLNPIKKKTKKTKMNAYFEKKKKSN